MTFSAIDTWWWHYAFIAIAGWLATDIWRWLGVLIGNRLDEGSQALILVRAIAVSLVAAVIAQLILFPSGALAQTPTWLRVGSAFAGFAAFHFAGQRIWVGVGVAIVLLALGQFAFAI